MVTPIFGWWRAQADNGIYTGSYNPTMYPLYLRCPTSRTGAGRAFKDSPEPHLDVIAVLMEVRNGGKIDRRSPALLSA